MSLLEQLAKKKQQQEQQNKSNQTNRPNDELVIGKPKVQEDKNTPDVPEVQESVNEQVKEVEEQTEENVVEEVKEAEEVKEEEVMEVVEEVEENKEDNEVTDEDDEVEVETEENKVAEVQESKNTESEEVSTQAQKSTQTQEKGRVVQMYSEDKKVPYKANKGHSEANSNVLPAPKVVTCEVYVYFKGNTVTRAEVVYNGEVYPVSREVFAQNVNKIKLGTHVYAGVATLVGKVVSSLEVSTPSALNVMFNDPTLDDFGVITPTQLLKMTDGLVETDEDWNEVKGEFGVVGVIRNPHGIITAFVLDMTKAD